MQSPDHPELVFLEARTSSGGPMYTVGRPDGPPLWHVIHDMEATETANCAENTAQYFHTGAGGRSVSSHYTVDNTSIVQCVLLNNSAWTVGNRPGNNRGINWELCGFASQSREQWLDPFGVAMMARIVPIMRSDGLRYGIPPERRTVAELKAGRPGVTSHNDLRLAFGNTTHTDPGGNFPWDYFMALLVGAAPTPQGDDDMYIVCEPNTSCWLIDGVDQESGLVRRWPLLTPPFDAYVAAGVPVRSMTTPMLAAHFKTMTKGLPRVACECVGEGGGGPLTVTLTGSLSGTMSGSATPQ